MSEFNLTTCKVIGSVYETYDYDMFKKMPRNRPVTAARKNKLAASLKRKNILNPLLVSPKGEIAEGQGRYEALKLLHLPIRFVVVQELVPEDCSILNDSNTNWTYANYIASWMEDPDEEKAAVFARIHGLLVETELSLGAVLRLAYKGQKSAGGKEDFIKNGTLTFTDIDVETVRNAWTKGKEIQAALGETKKPGLAFWSALRVMLDTPGYNHKSMLTNCKIRSMQYAEQKTAEGQAKKFEEIYNYNKTTKSKLYFSDFYRNRGYNVRNYTLLNAEQTVFAQDASTLEVRA